MMSKEYSKKHMLRLMPKWIKSWLEERRKEKAEKQKAEEQEKEERENMWKQIRDWSNMLDVSLPNFDGYVEYVGEKLNDYEFEHCYDLTNSKISAESLMWQRVRAKYGDAKVNVNTIHVPYPWNSWITWSRMISDEMRKIRRWRLYYSIKIAE